MTNLSQTRRDALTAALVEVGLTAKPSFVRKMVDALARVLDGADAFEEGEAIDEDFGREVYGDMLTRAKGAF